MATDKKQTEKLPKVVSKSFMAVGPTLHYSHKNVLRCWVLNVVIFGLCCVFFSKIVTGSFWSFNFADMVSPASWRLGKYVVEGVSIFEYPLQILVLALLMGVLGVAPMLVSQLMSFRYSLVFILAVVFAANLSGFAICLLVSCAAVACRPFRFRSRFTAIALCMAPQLIYWGLLGSVKGIEPLRWGFSFTPWIGAWLIGLTIVGLILGIGHFTRYRPGLVWIVTLAVLLATVGLFQLSIGFDELDYQLYVAKNNPEQITEFHDHSITDALDTTIENPEVKEYLLDGYFYPSDPISLRSKVKQRIQNELRFGRWPSWFIIPNELKYQQKTRWLMEQYDLFIKLRPDSSRMPVALYYKGLLSEYSPDISMLEQNEELHFYTDYPFQRSREIWYRLYQEFGDSPESLEARWRIAMHWASQGRFSRADELLAEAQQRIAEQLNTLEKQTVPTDSFFSLFRAPAETIMTKSKLYDLQRRADKLWVLIGAENRSAGEISEQRLVQFVRLNPHTSTYGALLQGLLEDTPADSEIRDNILLAKANLIADEQLCAETLSQLHEQFAGTDGGIEALYELALLKRRMWSQMDASNLEAKIQSLRQLRAILTRFIELYPESIYAEQTGRNLENLPTVE